ncbi:hypothetical protein LUZ63_003846 [Rhynchospora breviuscula]|uniref:Uncharacterized protein n=1 Tax=Rhynchospora breviuscula TaxID=2022672 RepID=A0A9Q0HZE1_9POAL|nr:hypothetical protein LUZ63_003846 [Rhynchospora breviuscula]
MAEVLTVVGWAISPLIKILSDKAQSFASDQCRWFKSTPADLLRLSSSLSQLQATASALSRRQRRSPDPHQSAWFSQLKDVIHEAEDVLDEFDYLILLSDSDPKVSRFFSSSSRSVKRLIGSDELMNRLKCLLKNIDDVNNSSQRLIQVVDADSSGSCRESDQSFCFSHVIGSVLTEDTVFGREKERADIVAKLTDSADRLYSRPVPVVAIVGDGGIGKTTLAQLIYNDPQVEQHFNLRMWVCVSDKFDEVNLTREIIQAATGNGENYDRIVNFAKLQRILQDSVASKRFLLILDDVWSDKEKNEWENREMWHKMLAPLQYGDRGSRILVTTQMKLVADIFNVRKPVFLRGLPEKDEWLLFKKSSLGDENTNEYPHLQEIGKKIVTKLKGSPLTVKAIGGMLRGTRSTRDWNEVLDRDIYKDTASALVSSYLHLPEYLQCCFSFCSVFPRNWRFDAKELVKMWMAHGFIQQEKGDDKRTEDLGKEYFNQLLAMSFFQPLKQGHRTCYVIHDLMHDLAKSVSVNNCARLVGQKRKSLSCTIHHLSVSSNNLAYLKNWPGLKNLRTLLIVEDHAFSLNRIQDDIMQELNGLRVLDFSNSGMVEVPESIGQLIHLRYLAFPDSLKRLPESISKLLHLQTLSIPKKSKLEKLPEGMSKLTNLRHLDVDLKHIATISSIHRLVNLQGSVEFRIKSEKGYMIEELKDMKHLHGQLIIKNLENVSGMEEARKSELSTKKFLKVVKLEWSSGGGTSITNVVDADVLQGVQPHENLEELHIMRYRGATSPSWMEQKVLNHLKSLYLINCRRWETMPPLGQLPSLKLLQIKEACSVRKIGPEFYGNFHVGFPSLQELELDDMPKWTKWYAGANTHLFPRLKKLKIANCPELIELPPFSLSVRKVSIENTKSMSCLKLSPFPSSKSINFSLETSYTTILPDSLLHQEHIQTIEFLNVKHCNETFSKKLSLLVSLKRLRLCQCAVTDYQLKICLESLVSLSALEIIGCSNIVSIPILNEPNCLATTLQELHVQDCQILSSLNFITKFKSLRSLVVERCEMLESSSFPCNLSSLVYLSKLSILYCPKFSSLPEAGLPVSLELLHLIGCNQNLTKNLIEKKGIEWEKVSIVSKVVIR